IARLSIIMRAMTEQGAVGDAARTAGSFTNRMKAAQAATLELAEAIGTAVLPVVTPVVDAFSSAVPIIVEWIKANEGLVIAIGALGVALTATGAAITATGAALIGLASVTAALASPVTLVVAGLGALAVAIVAVTAYSGDLQRALSDIS